MVVDVLKKLKGEAKVRQEQRRQQHRPSAAGGGIGQPCSAAVASGTVSASSSRPFEPAHSFFVSNNWKTLLGKKPTVAPRAAAAQTAAEKAAALGDGGAAANVVALDCEMVGVGATGTRSVLARVSLVDHEGNILLDKFVRPSEPVTDYRTHITGITAATFQGPGVIKAELARKLAAQVMDGKIVVGHALQNDFQALLFSHPHILIRDTALFRPLRPPGREKKTPSLARLSEHWLHESIHTGKHDSVEDARVALRLYRLRSRQWERQLRSGMAAHVRNSASGFGVDISAGNDDDGDGECIDAGDEGEPVERQSDAAGRRGPKRRCGEASSGTSRAATSTPVCTGKAKRHAEAEGLPTSESPASAASSSVISAVKANPSAKKRRRLAAQAKAAARAAAIVGAPRSISPATVAASPATPAAKANPFVKKRSRLAAQAKAAAAAAAEMQAFAGSASSSAKPRAVRLDIVSQSAGPAAKKTRRSATRAQRF
mmetsp:Transcript_101296/g.253957  ORF Transcript_101296/g.253957 Transcript_101296/m.253957 type:complete len:487 (-) Transcript_101296:120-1580(-)